MVVDVIQQVERTKLRRAMFALKTLELITRQGGGVSPVNQLARIKTVVREALEEIEATKPQGDMFEVQNVTAK